MVAPFAADAELYEILAVNVFHDGRLPTNTGSWGFVTVVFQAAEPHRPGGTDTAQLVVFNASTWTTPGQWGINYAGSTNVIVQWDGTLIGTQ
jgi:hypothetical protein